MIYHTCNQLLSKEKSPINSFNGQSIDIIYFDEIQRKWIATQNHYEYATYISYCPFCGIDL